MFQYLPRRRRLCDEPYQVHPPAAPAALERKHSVDARYQLRPHIARPLSRPRGAGNFAQRLWPGCFAPRRQQPAGLCRHQRPPRRVRRQYPKVAVPILARRRYQRRYPIQNFAGAQAKTVGALRTDRYRQPTRGGNFGSTIGPGCHIWLDGGSRRICRQQFYFPLTLY